MVHDGGVGFGPHRRPASQALVQALALELAPEVRVNGIAPGAMLWPQSADAASTQKMETHLPMQRAGGAQPIADTALFLATSDYITGEVIRVDGGRLLT